MMSSLRRMLVRKKRCVLMFILICSVFISFSWMMNNAEPVTPTVKDEFLRPNIIIPPKFNVLDEPPKKLDEPRKNSDFHPKIQNEISSFEIKNNTNSKMRVMATTPKKPMVFSGNESKQEENIKDVIVIKSEIINKQLSNDSVEIETAKNKTLAQMGVLGLSDGEISKKIVFADNKWKLSVSFEDIGNVMKDTSFFNKLKPLDVRGPLLTSTKNRTANFSLSMPIKMGYCDCWEHYCFCCVQLVNKQLHLNTKSCANFTFISKSHELDVTFSLDGTKVHNEIISADAPPLLCMGSIPKVADMCVHFSNMTYKVDGLAMHKSQLLGCTDFSFNIYNKTVNVFPVDCFQIPGDPNHHPKHEQIILPNFVP